MTVRISRLSGNFECNKYFVSFLALWRWTINNNRVMDRVGWGDVIATDHCSLLSVFM